MAPHSHYGWEESEDTAPLQGRPNRQRGDMNLLVAPEGALTFNVVPEGGQGADLVVSETDVSGALSALNGQAHDRVTMVVEGDPKALNLRGREEGIRPELDDVASLRAASGGSSKSYLMHLGVRRLTPVECERLQGLEDDWTAAGKYSDSKRYAGLGDAVTANVGHWLGDRFTIVDSLLHS